MKFSEIKHKIRNLGNFKSLKEIKKAGLRVVRNTKTGDYWLIEEEFLKPVLISPRQLNTVIIGKRFLTTKVLFCTVSSESKLKKAFIYSYIKWGESQHYHKRSTLANKKIWWKLDQNHTEFIAWAMMHRARHNVHINFERIQLDHNFFGIKAKKDDFLLNLSLGITCLSSYMMLQKELLGRRYGGGGGPIKNEGVDIIQLLVVKPNLFAKNTLCKKLFDSRVRAIFEDFGFDPLKPIRQQEPNPLPDRKALDDIVFDALGLTKKERKEIYWAVAELVKNRLEKAKSIKNAEEKR